MTKIYRITNAHKKEEIVEIDQGRFNQLLQVISYIKSTSPKAKIIKDNSDREKTVITLREDKSELLTLEVHEYRDSARYYYKEAA